MNNEDIIAKLTLGTDEIEKITIDDGTEIEIRPLNSGELAVLQKIEKSPYTMTMKMNRNGERIPVDRQDVNENNTMDIGMGDFAEAKSKIMHTAVAWSMDAPVKTVQGFRKGVPEQIFKEVLRISNITKDDLDSLKEFR